MRPAAALGLALLLGACASVPPRAELARPSHARAQSLEVDGHLRAALLEWKVARAIEPDDAAARAAEARLAARIEGLVATKVTEARGALQRGAALQARRLLLAALALDPANATAADMLRGIGDVEFVTYTVRAGDTLASLAQRYYGDRSRGEVIWET
ncbi:MAG TPA: LysM domain-containing protein, partial [Methylomirabilota bacterium]|nr:LysM domain-containing protein [Methylomirabilota bacterium]